MRAFVCLFVLLPLAFAAPEKRFVLDTLSGIVSLDTLKKDVQIMLDVVGSDPTEQACETECHVLIKNDLLDTACPLVCHSFQSLVHYFALTPDTTTLGLSPSGV